MMMMLRNRSCAAQSASASVVRRLASRTLPSATHFTTTVIRSLHTTTRPNLSRQKKGSAVPPPHVHQGLNCPICREWKGDDEHIDDGKGGGVAAVATTVSEAGKAPIDWSSSSSSSPTTHSAEALHENGDSGVLLPAHSSSPFPEWLQDPEGDCVTMEGMRAQGLREFLRMEMEMMNRGGNGEVGSLQNSTLTITQEELALWEKFEMKHQEALSDGEYATLVTFLDKTMKNASARNDSTGSNGDEAVEEDPNQQQQPSLKQQQFTKALSDIRSVLNATLSQPLSSSPDGADTFFLCCGTALGAIREKQFIEYDNDIDIGIFYDTLGPDPASVIMDVLSKLGSGLGGFICFDVIGEIDFGFEMRLRHQETGVLVDINVYYNSNMPTEAAAHQSDDKDASPFVWCATHYEESSARKHGMYRYRHEPFKHSLELVDPSFVGGSGYLVPPVSHLVEYFGDDWRVPKKFSYEEGLGGEYKNIIAE